MLLMREGRAVAAASFEDGLEYRGLCADEHVRGRHRDRRAGRSRHHVTTKVGGRLIDAVHEITRFDPPRLIEERITSGDRVVVASDEVRPLGEDRCVLTVRLEIEWGGGLMDMLSRLAFRLGERSRRNVLERIREVAESSDPT